MGFTDSLLGGVSCNEDCCWCCSIPCAMAETGNHASCVAATWQMA